MDDPRDHGEQRIGIALAGGGPEGAIYEIGAIRALDEAIEGLCLTELPVYVGVSAGAFVASCLANGIKTDQLCRAIVSHEPGEHPFVPDTFLTPAFREFAHRGLMVPRLVVEALLKFAQDPWDMSLLESLTRLSRALPTGIFTNDAIREYLENIFSIKGRTDDFRKLGTSLRIVSADLDSGSAVRFGDEGLDHVPISLAVQASTALPGVYPPVEIDGRHYADGVLLKTVHASVALDQRVSLLICLNPIVPVDTARAVEQGVMKRGKLIDRGLPSVIAQALRTLIHSRMVVGMSAYKPRYPDADVMLIEPKRDDYRMFFTNIFSFSARKDTCEHAYRETLAFLRRQMQNLAPILQRHDLRLRPEVLEDENRSLWDQVGLPEPGKRSPVGASLGRTLSRLERVVSDLDARVESAAEVSAEDADSGSIGS